MSFQKILNDDAVHSWKYEIQVQKKIMLMVFTGEQWLTHISTISLIYVVTPTILKQQVNSKLFDFFI